ncbi:GNAT family N-acetyltransferase [Mucilaginibacter sp. ZT4R22]|uniref:GNAT family N-acetyltransferase n=1 Tax=Mucilaginibacter pankratovii TaxID=2772110 RepID=A0ABR7WT59_9SPHI|nr:GNAT family protein [Mucilaginibacter pankratovii]MBD1365475.1 GNAT family N-acetyltransferase [Mucilaginibacter pankratovii]
MNLPPYSQFPQLTGDGILLREVLPADIPALIPISFYDGKPATTFAEATEMQVRIDKDYADRNSIHWCIVDTATSQITGTLGYYRGFANNTGELGFVLLPRYQGKGYMSKAINLAVNFGLDIIGLSRVTAITTKQNLKAVQLLTRLNFAKVKELNEDEVEYETVA